ncbi:MAG TPA: quinol:electron acceptor oxidoreductase subunit ActD [Chloroflexota bacterium]|nr:quinol:electron acceptor oxidoreductase subunit ActD [Chloroflexota bacterium]
MAVTSILALYSDAVAAADGVIALHEAGLSDDNFELLTDTPYPEGAFGEQPVHHRLYVFPLVGAFCGLVVAVLLTTGTQLAYPLITGGKPILAIPPMLIIWFEGIMLGAIGMTFVGFFFEARLPRIHLGLYDPRIAEGYIGLLVSTDESIIGDAEKALRSSGAVDVIRQGEGEG